MPAKVITEILDKYATAPKSNMQALEDHELSIVFEHLTQNNQISSIAAIYADEPKPEAPRQRRLRPKVSRRASPPRQPPGGSLPSPSRARSSVLPSRRTPSVPPSRPSLSAPLSKKSASRPAAGSPPAEV